METLRNLSVIAWIGEKVGIAEDPRGVVETTENDLYAGTGNS